MTDHEQLVDEASNYITALIYQLGNSYDVLHPQDVDITELGTAIDALTFVNEKLHEQKIKLESYRKKLLSNVAEVK